MSPFLFLKWMDNGMFLDDFIIKEDSTVVNYIFKKNENVFKLS